MEASRLHSETPSALPIGTRLGEFELLSLLGVGGFGIVYLAFDHALEREVAVKEYMPASLAGRTETMHVSLRSQNDAETFALGLKSFVNEARLLARFDHPSLLKVHRFWEANGTAYMAMPVMRGRTVKEVRLDMVGAPDEAWLRALLDPLLGAIDKLHSEGVYHRDIAPDNIQIEPGGRPVLLDFGAARRVLSDKSQTLTAILKPAYAPIEQYAEAGAVKQGPWTDIYALGATLHFLLLARPPPPATTRAVHDEASALTTRVLPGCSAEFLHIIDWMLAPRPSDRPQSVAALRDVLEGRVPPPVRREPVPSVSQWDRTVMLPAAGGVTTLSPRPPPDPRLDEATLVMPRATPASQSPQAMATPSPQVAPEMAKQGLAVDPVPALPIAVNMPAAQPGAKSKLLLVGLAVTAVAVAAAAAFFWPRQTVPPPLAADAAASAPVSVLSLPPAAAVPESQVTTVTVPGAAAPSPAAVSQSPASVVAVVPPAANPNAGAAAVRLPAPQPRSQPVANNPRPSAANTTAVATAPSPATTTPGSGTPQAEAPRAQIPPAVAALPPAPLSELPKPVAAGPEARCGGKNPLSYFICMERECLRSEVAGHADCLKWRQNAKRE